MKHNPKFGETYLMSPTMLIYQNSLISKQLLRYGLSSFTSEFVFGKNYKQTLENMYNTSLCELKKSKEPPNTMHKYGASNIVTTNEFDNLKMMLLPYIHEMYGIDPCKKCYLFTDFSVHYGSSYDRKLNEHVDDSDITINICLKNTLKYTGLKFTHTPDTLFSVKSGNATFVNFEEGDILIHSGKQRHMVQQLTDEQILDYGERVNLILWLKFRL